MTMDHSHVFGARQHPNGHTHSSNYEDDFDFVFDESVSQPYLSLGLTPASQLSPDHDTGYFPGLPPPISPAINDSSYNISVDSSVYIKMNPMARQDPVSTSGHVRRAVRSGPRDLKESLSHSRGKLETVPEDINTSPAEAGGRMSKSSGQSFRWSPQESDLVRHENTPFMPGSQELNIFPSASLSVGQGSQGSQGSRTRRAGSNLPRFTSLGTTGTTSHNNGSSPDTRRASVDGTFLYPVSSMKWDDQDEPVRDHTHSPDSGSRHNRRSKREQQEAAREAAREKLRLQMLEEERAKIRRQDKRARKLSDPEGRLMSNSVMHQAAQYDAKVDLMSEGRHLNTHYRSMSTHSNRSSVHSPDSMGYPLQEFRTPTHVTPTSAHQMNGFHALSPLSPLSPQYPSDEDYSTTDHVTSL